MVVVEGLPLGLEYSTNKRTSRTTRVLPMILVARFVVIHSELCSLETLLASVTVQAPRIPRHTIVMGLVDGGGGLTSPRLLIFYPTHTSHRE